MSVQRPPHCNSATTSVLLSAPGSSAPMFLTFGDDIGRSAGVAVAVALLAPALVAVVGLLLSARLPRHGNRSRFADPARSQL